MDADAYLKKQGWRGTGHSLDSTDRGIKRALQISKKVDALGVGVQKYGAVSDQWWMRAYDQGLKNLGTGQEGDLEKVQKLGHDRGGLYSRFVKGQPIPGTIDEYIQAITAQKDQSKKRKSRTSADTKQKLKKRKQLMQRAELAMQQNDTDMRVLVKEFVAEATRRGIIPNKAGEVSSTLYSPSEADMTQVLLLAGLDGAKQELKRQHMVRALRRAAVQHIEATRPP